MQENIAEQKYKHEIRQLIPINYLSTLLQEQLIYQAEVVMIPNGTSLFEQDEKCECLYYLLSGDVDLYRNQEIVKTVSAGTASSRIALNKNLSFSAIAKSRVVLLMVDRILVERLVILGGNIDLAGDSANENNQHWVTPLLSSKVFSQIPPSNLHKTFDRLDSMIVKKGDQVVTQNMPGNYLYIIREGSCVVTKHNHNTDETIKVAELEVGDCFGEEALLSDRKRNTSVTMLTAGRLMRLSCKDYEELMDQHTLNVVDFDQASSRVKQGAKWLDVRFKDEFSQWHLEDSQNIPLPQLGQDLDELSKDKSYIIYCETGIRSSAAAALLNGRGFDVSYLEGGVRQYPEENDMSENWLDGLSDVLRNKGQKQTGSLPEKQIDMSHIRESIGKQVMAVDRKIRDLKAIFTTENLLAQEWLENDQPAEDLGILIEARKKIDHIEEMPATTLHEQTKEQSDNELGLLRKQLESAQNHIQEERNRVTTDDKDSEQKELTLKRVSEELEVIKNRLKEQETFELTRRESFEQQLATERKKMREQLARFTMGIESQQTKSMEIEQIRRAAALETRHILEKFKNAHEQYRIYQQKTIQTVRKQLQQQATQVIQKARQAQAEKAAALASLRAVQKQLNELRKQRGSLKAEQTGASDVPMLVDVESVGDEIEKAKDKFYQADSELSLAKMAKQQNQEMLDQVAKNESSVRHELVNWFISNDQFKLDRDNLTEEQKASLERVKKIAHEALEEAFNGNHHRSDGAGGHFFKNYK